MNNNQVTLSGKIVSAFKFSHEVFGEVFYRTYISVSRTSGTIDTIPLIVSERIVDVSHNFTNDNVHINGQFRTYNRHENGKYSLLVNVFVDEFIPTKCGHSTDDSNEIHLEGYICKEPTFRRTPYGRQISDFVLAVNRKYSKADYIPCICWGRDAVFMSNLKVGSYIQLYGRIQSREYVKNYVDYSEYHTVYEVSVSRIK